MGIPIGLFIKQPLFQARDREETQGEPQNYSGKAECWYLAHKGTKSKSQESSPNQLGTHLLCDWPVTTKAGEKMEAGLEPTVVITQSYILTPQLQ